MSEIGAIVIPSLLAAFGFIGRYFWERHDQSRSNARKEKEESVSFKLQKFYYPIYFNLNKLKHLREFMTSTGSDDEITRCIDEECVRIHMDNQNIIRNNLVEAKPVPKLLDAIMLYDRHVSIHCMLQKIKSKAKAKAFDAEYPEQFKDIIMKRINTLENGYNKERCV